MIFKTKKQRTILNAAWLNCPNCDTTWRGCDFSPMYEKAVRDANPEMPEEEVKKHAKANMKKHGTWRKRMPAIAQDEKGLYHCMHCNHIYTYDDIERLVSHYRPAIIIAKVVFFFCKIFHRQ